MVFRGKNAYNIIIIHTHIHTYTKKRLLEHSELEQLANKKYVLQFYCFVSKLSVMFLVSLCSILDLTE